MADATSRLFSLLGIMLCIWVAVYWLYEPTTRRSVVLDDRPVEAGADRPPALPDLPEPRSLPPFDPQPAIPEAMPRPSPAQPEVQSDPMPPAPVAGPGEVLIPPQFDDYIVQSGDTFQTIARRFYGDAGRWKAISRANPLLTPEKLKPGVTVVRIPRDPDNIQGKVVKIERPAQPSAPVLPAPNPEKEIVPPKSDPASAGGVGAMGGWRTYTVRDNDTLWGIAKQMYGRPSLTDLIAQANSDVLPDPDKLSPGIVLKIPPAPPAD